MEFYRKNPVIKDVIWVQGERVDDETVLAGDEFKPFSDPSTFPGVPPKLVKMEPEKLSPEQLGDASDLVKKQSERPPRHLGVIKSSQFAVTPECAVRVYEEMVRDIPVKADGAVVVGGQAEKDSVAVVDGGVEKLLSELYSEQELIEAFPGITVKNASKVLSSFKLLPDLARASNVDLKMAGVQPSYYRRVRRVATNARVDGGK